ncbi:hypothetical protein [Paraburkholderia sp. GAS333]|uniref:hypothetical protein n=1 Tax=Paraburkholderia sp. GAS333 TaxID=3156279 RepID=UPI003D196196
MPPQKVLTDLLGANGDNAAIAACILLNVSLITVDGANFNSIGGNPFEIPAFLLKLQEYSGIPVLFSGTCAFMHFMSLKGSPSANLFGEPSLHLDPNEAPKLGEDQRPVGEGVWYQKNVWYWSLGMFSRDIPMPEYLPVWTYRAARGRDGWLAEGFEALHTELIKKPRLLEPEKLTEEAVTKIFELRLRAQREARVAITQQQEQDYVEDEEDFFNFMDHFPLSFIRNKTNKSRIRAAMGSR